MKTKLDEALEYCNAELADHWRKYERRPSVDWLDELSTYLLLADELMRREAIKAKFATYTPEQWAELEREHTPVPPEPDELDDDEAVCHAWNCIRIFRKKGIKRYCSKKCGDNQNSAVRRKKKTGTYLPRKLYMPVWSDYANKRFERREIRYPGGNSFERRARKQYEKRVLGFKQKPKYEVHTEKDNHYHVAVRFVKRADVIESVKERTIRPEVMRRYLRMKYKKPQ
ncbi:hypothetical protein ACE1TF_11960 [Geomicrobium sp. JSM 1781026]|uniref:hypothetical protein n=1 Tax=Geomicrobium sp. JSM 1781026 TaxID=3344580 RepID=UPI0035C182AA